MQQIPKELILRALAVENPWWTNEPKPYSQLPSRPYLELFYPLVIEREPRRAVVLMGPRRVGKTVLIHHAIARLLKEGMAPPNVCYISVDNPIYNRLSLVQLLDLYSEATGVNYASTPSYVFFDEVQYLGNWEGHLKSIVDTYPGVKCVASGSAAAALKFRSNESGAGRFTDFLLPPLTFHEFMTLSGKPQIVKIEGDRENQKIWTDEIGQLNDYFLEYLNYGGYPEIALSERVRSDPARYIKADIIDKVLLRDLPSVYGIQDIPELNSLFTALAYNTAQEVSLEELSKNSGVAKQTIKRYLEYLEAAFLIKSVSRVDRDARSFQRARQFKVYLANPTMRTALFAASKSDDEGVGHIVETAIFAQWFHSPTRLHYARWNKGEVDIVHLDPSGAVGWALEVKWSDSYMDHPDKLSRQVGFCRRHEIKDLQVTTKTQTGVHDCEGINVRFQPAALYCYQAGYNIIRWKALSSR